MQAQTTPTAWRNDAPLAARTLSTEQAAAALHIRPQTLRAALCRDGHYFGIRPLKRNRSLSGVLCPPAPTRNNPSHIHQGGAGSDQGDSDQQQVAAA